MIQTLYPFKPIYHTKFWFFQSITCISENFHASYGFSLPKFSEAYQTLLNELSNNDISKLSPMQHVLLPNTMSNKNLKITHSWAQNQTFSLSDWASILHTNKSSIKELSLYDTTCDLAGKLQPEKNWCHINITYTGGRTMTFLAGTLNTTPEVLYITQFDEEHCLLEI